MHSRLASAAVTLIFAFVAVAHGQSAPCKSTVTGDLQISSFPSKTFGDTATVRVWLPPGYNDAATAQTKYSVLYLLDGQNLFDKCTAFAQKAEWQVDETMTQLINAGKIPPMIVVGIDNADTQRANQYLPYQDFEYMTTPGEPAGKRFPLFLANDVLPYIKAKYRVETGPAHTTIGGSSYGAVAALYAVLTRSDLFGSALLESTALQVGNGQMIRDTNPLPSGPARVYIGIGTRESEDSGSTTPEDRLASFRKSAGFEKLSEMLAANFRSAMMTHADVMFVVEDGAHHNETAWAGRFPKAAEFLFGKH